MRRGSSESSSEAEPELLRADQQHLRAEKAPANQPHRRASGLSGRGREFGKRVVLSLFLLQSEELHFVAVHIPHS